MFCPIRCLIVVFSGSCLTVITLLGKRGVLFYFSLVYGLCTICLGLVLFLLVSLVGYVL